MDKQARKAIIQSIIEKAGGQTALARLLQPYHPNIRQQHVEKWLRYGYRIPGEYCPTIEAVTGISKEALRPDIYAERSLSRPIRPQPPERREGAAARETAA
ncbi:MAG: helix-turn-helix domain-containing protein [Candidatus Competibacteraceae bacterium]|nr:helix-turn-helix domain-containing protein [Candidatus Competibacteraceae bacterium]MBK8896621.1 helix-turn-helix domain-containing protein [Candidatus Competibacteraceae bacterium]MBK8896684.1 helix-turn-helix domain-containing protein [Candidatus Competibacteraceae bacterium]MBK8896726.1 helix-turn-helix domain-containing protein [Candidatus Competibacteraceae bacterium]MBK8896867.1 helix-turn-helix domain-containing protein [Candidatus Competibacteraceae bacterium]